MADDSETTQHFRGLQDSEGIVNLHHDQMTRKAQGVTSQLDSVAGLKHDQTVFDRRAMFVMILNSHHAEILLKKKRLGHSI
jgi:hypothetical protein